jgi:predicted RNA binding protein YcfA (HicA-like mRNA interferase family)
MVTFGGSNQNYERMKYTEYHSLIRKNGWKYSHAKGSHYFYLKDGILSPPVPYHGAKEMGNGIRRKLAKQLGL